MTSSPTAPDERSTISTKPASLSAAPYEHPDARCLTRALREEQMELYGFADDPGTIPETDFDPSSGGLFLVARVGSRSVGCGGVRLLDETTAEVKSMYVAKNARGQGIGRDILEHLERHAAAYGVTRIVLETGQRNTAALALYGRAGYEPCPSYVPGRDHRVNRAMMKPLGGRAS
ncbi:GNAT family N-acetyltransferase [Streptomyces sp. NPDC004682]